MSLHAKKACCWTALSGSSEASSSAQTHTHLSGSGTLSASRCSALSGVEVRGRPGPAVLTSVIMICAQTGQAGR